METNPYRTDVSRGAEYLDTNMPGWADRIDLDILDIEDSVRCVAGQVYASNAQESGFSSGFSWANANAKGFNCCVMGMCGLNAALKPLWVEQVQRRTGAWVEPEAEVAS